MNRIVIASRNRGKIGEITAILSGAGVELSSLDAFPPYPEPEETGTTFTENAMIKARAAFEATGLPSLADDSGIVVDALGGEPGVRSARYGGEGLTDAGRCEALLKAMEKVPAGERTARFMCVMVLFPAPRDPLKAFVTEGILEGTIAFEPSGENGFGYDPVFFVPEKGKTVAMMSGGEKNAISHRYRALVEMKGLLCGWRGDE